MREKPTEGWRIRLYPKQNVAHGMAARKGAYARLDSLGDLLYLVEQREGQRYKTSQSMRSQHQRPKAQTACQGPSLLVCPHRRTGGDRRRFTSSILDNKTPLTGMEVSAEGSLDEDESVTGCAWPVRVERRSVNQPGSQ